jgi:hypothetical protein
MYSFIPFDVGTSLESLDGWTEDDDGLGGAVVRADSSRVCGERKRKRGE